MQMNNQIHGGGTINVIANPNLVAAGTYNVDGADAFRLQAGGSDFTGNIVVGPGAKLGVSSGAIGTGKIFMTAGTFTPGTQNGNFSMLIAQSNVTYGNDVEVLAGSGSFITLNSPTQNATPLWGNLRVGSFTVGVNKNTASSSPNTVGFTSVTLTGGASGPTVFAPTSPGYANVGGGTANMALANIGEAVAGSSIVMNGFTSLTITGTNTYTGTTTVSNGSLLLGNGSQGASFASTAAFTNNATVAFNSDGSVTLAGSITGTGNVLHLGTGSSSVAGRIVAQSLSVSAGQLKIAAKGSANSPTGTSVVKALTITGGQLDLTNNSLIVDYTSPIGTLVDDTRMMLASGSLTTSAGTSSLRLGYGDNNVLKKTGTFAGEPLDADFTDLLIKYTYAGDANLDGKVNALDFNALATNFGTGSDWTKGDFDYNGNVNTTDFNFIAQNFNAAAIPSSPLGALVPEPSSLAVVLGAGLLLRRRQRA
jgi:autotransporter-associated beta strand protein